MRVSPLDRIARCAATAALSLMAFGVPVRAGVIHPTAEEVASLARVVGPALSPDGRTLVYQRDAAHRDAAAKPTDGDSRGGWSVDRQLWVLRSTGGAPRQLTHESDASREPRWAPDGRSIAFLRVHDGKARLQILSLDGGEAETVETGVLEPTTFRWSPDGRSIAFTAPVPDTPEQKEAAWRSGGVRRFGADWTPAAIYTVPRQGGTPQRISRGSDHVVAFEWSPDGTRFAVLTAPSADPYEELMHATPRVISARDGGPGRVLDPKARVYETLAWSPDGRWVALTAATQTLTMLNTLELCDPASGAIRTLSPGLDRTFAGVTWMPDSRALVAVVRQRTGTRLVRFDVDGGAVTDLGLERRAVDGPVLIPPGGRPLLFVSSWEDRTPSISAFDPGGDSARVLAEVDPEVAGWAIGRQEVVRWRNSEGVEIEGLLMLPPGLKAGARPPLFVTPHGGPDDVTSRRFSAFTLFFAAHGYAVLRPNYRGSLGYGRDFYAANRGRFGEIETADIESGVDALIAAGRVDPGRLYFGGWSWGGYISAWTLTHQSRYLAIVVGAGVNDVAFSYSTSDINHGDAAQWEYLGNPWLQLQNFDRANPIRFVKNAKTPTLILHGQADTRVPFPQGVMLYRGLVDVGCPVAFYTYPREPHEFVEPAHNAHVLSTWLDWYDSHPPAGARRAAGARAER